MLISDGVRLVPGVIADKATRRGFFVSSFLLTVNWGLFVYAVQAGHAIDAALGYFIYPLVAVVLGILLLGEKLDWLGWVAVGIVVCGVLAKTWLDGRPPIIGLCLAATFGLYGVTRKRMGIDPVMGMFVETLVVMPLAAGYLIWMFHDGQPVFYGGGFFNSLLALFAGVITVVPLLLYHAGNRDLPFHHGQPAVLRQPDDPALPWRFCLWRSVYAWRWVDLWSDLDWHHCLFHQPAKGAPGVRHLLATNERDQIIWSLFGRRRRDGGFLSVDDACRDDLVGVGRWLANGNLAHHVHAALNLSPYGVLACQMATALKTDEKLAVA